VQHIGRDPMAAHRGVDKAVVQFCQAAEVGFAVVPDGHECVERFTDFVVMQLCRVESQEQFDAELLGPFADLGERSRSAGIEDHEQQDHECIGVVNAVVPLLGDDVVGGVAKAQGLEHGHYGGKGRGQGLGPEGGHSDSSSEIDSRPISCPSTGYLRVS
jgi:hypothetical protein